VVYVRRPIWVDGRIMLLLVCVNTMFIAHKKVTKKQQIFLIDIHDMTLLNFNVKVFEQNTFSL